MQFEFGVITSAIRLLPRSLCISVFGGLSLAGLLLEQHTLDYSESGNIKHIAVVISFILIVINDVRALHSTG
jgi:hypothetical protein